MKRSPGNAAIAQPPTVRADLASGGPPVAVKPRLLLVDDERHVLDGLALHLRRKYDVVVRTSGAAALDALEEGEPLIAGRVRRGEQRARREPDSPRAEALVRTRRRA